MRKNLPSDRTFILPATSGLVTGHPIISQQHHGEPLGKAGETSS